MHFELAGYLNSAPKNNEVWVTFDKVYPPYKAGGVANEFSSNNLFFVTVHAKAEALVLDAWTSRYKLSAVA